MILHLPIISTFPLCNCVALQTQGNWKKAKILTHTLSPLTLSRGKKRKRRETKGTPNRREGGGAKILAERSGIVRGERVWARMLAVLQFSMITNHYHSDTGGGLLHAYKSLPIYC